MAGALLPELISAEMWAPAPTFDGSASTAAGALLGVVSQINAILDGQQTNTSVLRAAWASPTGERAVSANTPYQVWLTDMASQISAAAHQIYTAGADFAAARMATPHPGEFVANWTEFFILLATNFLGLNTLKIVENRAQYAQLVARTMTAYHTYGSESAATVQTLPALPSPPVSATPDPSIGAQPGARPPMGPAMQGMDAVWSAGSAAAQPVATLAQLSAQPSNALMASGGELASGPSAMTSGLGALPSMASAPMTSGLGSPTAGSPSAGAESGGVLGASAGAATVAAALSGGGAGLSGLSGAAPAPMRGPVSWASRTDAANPTPNTEQVMVSRIAEARAASAAPATSAGMGAPGAMMPPARQESASMRQRGVNDTLAPAGVVYLPPRDMPVVTGAAGAQVVAGEEDQ